jgi:hypothetical protein
LESEHVKAKLQKKHRCKGSQCWFAFITEMDALFRAADTFIIFFATLRSSDTSLPSLFALVDAGEEAADRL